MKRKRSLVDDRRNQILEELRQTGEIKVDELAQKWSTSPLTIRRDLQYLEDHKAIARFYGGATYLEPSIPEEDVVDSCRRLIAQYAASLVNDGESIFINTSMTALEIIRYLGDKRVTVVTNNGRILSMDVPPNLSVFLVGGEIRYPKYAMVGEFALRNLENVSVKKSFMGCSGLTPEMGMTTEIMNEVPINKLMFKHVTGEAYLLADHTKIGKNSSFVSQSIDNIHHLISDELAPAGIVESLREKNINVHLVSKPAITATKHLRIVSD